MITKSYGVIGRNDEGKILMVQEQKGHWGFPKGRKEKGEKPLETARRELFEETGSTIKLNSEKILYKTFHYYLKPKFVLKITGLFEGMINEKEIKIQDGEIINAGWFTVSEALELKTPKRTKWVLQKLAL